MTLPLPSHQHRAKGGGTVMVCGVVHCPYCGKRIGLDYRCPHLDELLTPGENAGQWAVVVREEPFEIPVLKMEARPKPKPPAERTPKPRKSTPRASYGGWMDLVRQSLVLGRGTSPEIEARLGCKKSTVTMNLHRLWARGEAEIVGRERYGTRRKIASIYALTAAGKRAARKAPVDAAERVG